MGEVNSQGRLETSDAFRNNPQGAGGVYPVKMPPHLRRGWCAWLSAWRRYLGSYRSEHRLLVFGVVTLSIATVELATKGFLTGRLALALVELTGTLFVADALGRIVAGTVLDHLFERRVGRLCPTLRLHALATGDLDGVEVQARDVLEHVLTPARSGSEVAEGPSRRENLSSEVQR